MGHGSMLLCSLSDRLCRSNLKMHLTSSATAEHHPPVPHREPGSSRRPPSSIALSSCPVMQLAYSSPTHIVPPQPSTNIFLSPTPPPLPPVCAALPVRRSIHPRPRRRAIESPGVVNRVRPQLLTGALQRRRRRRRRRRPRRGRLAAGA